MKYGEEVAVQCKLYTGECTTRFKTAYTVGLTSSEFDDFPDTLRSYAQCPIYERLMKEIKRCKCKLFTPNNT